MADKHSAKSNVAMRAVTAWLWVRKLRDHWPADRGALLTLYSMASYMDARRGVCFVKQSTLAEKTGAVERTVRRHIERAIELGFLVSWESRRRQGGQGWRRTYYQAHVPSSINLDVDEQQLADTVSSFDASTAAHARPAVIRQPYSKESARDHGSVDDESTMDADVRTSEGVRTGHFEPKVRTFEAEGPDTRRTDSPSTSGADTAPTASEGNGGEFKHLRGTEGADIPAGEGADNPPPKYSEKYSEKRSDVAPIPASHVQAEPDLETRHRKIRSMVQAMKGADDHVVARMLGALGVTPDEVRRVRAA